MLESLARAEALAGLTARRSDDFAITLLELWAAVGDVLTFYQERYANEAFLPHRDGGRSRCRGSPRCSATASRPGRQR